VWGIHELAVATAMYVIAASVARAESTLTAEAIADTFITSDPDTGGGTGASRANVDSDNSGFGAMMISANVTNPVQGISYPRSMWSFVAFDTAAIKAAFDAQYGANLWHITDVAVKFYSNFSISGVPANNNQFNVPHPGYFTLSWLGNDTWFDPATAGPAGRTQADLTWNNRGKYLDGTVIESVSPPNGFYWAGGDYNGTTACGGGTFAPAAPPCFSSIWHLEQTASLVNDILDGGVISLIGTPADDQVVYLINQLTKPDAYPQILVAAEAGSIPRATPAPTPVPTATPLPTSTPTPIPTPVPTAGPTPAPTASPEPSAEPSPTDCTSNIPQIDPQQREWLVRAGQTLGFAITAYDCLNRPVTIKAKKLPPGASFTQSFDSLLGRQKGLFSWAPPVNQVGRTRQLQFKAVVQVKGGGKASRPQTASIQVLPPALGDAGAFDSVVKRLVITRAVWNKATGQFALRGAIQWQKGTSRSVRAVAIGQTVRIIDVSSNAVLLETQSSVSGRWSAAVSLPLDTPPPDVVEAEFGGKSSLPQKVQFAP